MLVYPNYLNESISHFSYELPCSNSSLQKAKLACFTDPYPKKAPFPLTAVATTASCRLICLPELAYTASKNQSLPYLQ